MVSEPRLRLPASELSRLNRLRKEVPQRRKQTMGPQNARRSHRRSGLDHPARLRRSKTCRDHGRFLWRVCGAWGVGGFFRGNFFLGGGSSVPPPSKNYATDPPPLLGPFFSLLFCARGTRT